MPSQPSRRWFAAILPIGVTATLLLPVSAQTEIEAPAPAGFTPPPLQQGSPPLVPPLNPIWQDFWFLNDCTALGRCDQLYTLNCPPGFSEASGPRPCEFCDYPSAVVSECRVTFDLTKNCLQVGDAWPDCGKHWVGQCRLNGTCDSIWDGNRCVRTLCVQQ
ncbi:MAG: hypothetical protein U0575_10085 [Phycisphaerales bacterium]